MHTYQYGFQFLFLKRVHNWLKTQHGRKKPVSKKIHKTVILQPMLAGRQAHNNYMLYQLYRRYKTSYYAAPNKIDRC